MVPAADDGRAAAGNGGSANAPVHSCIPRTAQAIRALLRGSKGRTKRSWLTDEREQVLRAPRVRGACGVASSLPAFPVLVVAGLRIHVHMNPWPAPRAS